MELDKWELVNESFCYPFEEIRSVNRSVFFSVELNQEFGISGALFYFSVYQLTSSKLLDIVTLSLLVPSFF